VTIKTVETHLENAYNKLAIRSRTQLAEALRTGGEPPERAAVAHAPAP
jgi:DNA-binding NarL/FixJ family response regulator